MTDSSRRFSAAQDATRGRLLALLREGSRTVDDLADRLDLTDNAVRFHLTALLNAGSVRKQGVVRKPSAGKPAAVYSLTAEAADSFSRAYAPLLTASFAELHETMSTQQFVAFLKRVGKRLGRGFASPSGPLSRRVAGASELLNSLGGLTAVEKVGNGYSIVGRACPLSSAVASDHCVCGAVTSLVAQIVDADVTERCDRSGRPRCHFEISAQS